MFIQAGTICNVDDSDTEELKMCQASISVQESKHAMANAPLFPISMIGNMGKGS